MPATPDSPTRTNTAIVGFERTFAEALAPLTVPWQGADAPDPRLIVVNEQLAASLRLDVESLRTDDGVEMLCGAAAPADATPVATAYSGHQFGGYSPLLGDGRALLLGELTDTDGRRVDLQLKGSGPTPFSRGGDGFAVVGPMLREYLVSEAMHALGIPTTRSLSVVATGRGIQRTGIEPGAVLARVAASHLRVGTFEYTARNTELLQPLADYAISRHYPELRDLPETGGGNRYIKFFEAVLERQAALLAKWMLVGFVHGVMNTDNTTISGETIDYGPCAFLDAFDPSAVFSSIDHGGRYGFGNQPAVLKWNLARFAETMLTLVGPTPDDAIAAATAVLSTFDARYDRHFYAGMSAKLGLGDAFTDHELIDALLVLMQEHRADWTGTFRALADDLRGNPVPLRSAVPREHIDPWVQRWRDALTQHGRDDLETAAAMDRINPLYIPRNHQLDAALRAATDGDIAPFEQLLDAVTHPFVHRAEWAHHAAPAPAAFSDTFQTFCGT
ncbi:YdiU family protein [Gordonia jinghuaiqii]|uniref:Protein nucleotidyltransferase YdiU n=1 Tax=Gordonia jinghuaiqii TaxID=2758710 RepID=A0A7D7QFM8_9ACTN|nr:YdiU family protein [Gordonia jinghuaiqii]MCR5976681.1 YdiU family protein [Gordonia jinghuaiqii]QMS99861.1 YdiU family protein [Gordonia jinghuaiqii]